MARHFCLDFDRSVRQSLTDMDCVLPVKEGVPCFRNQISF